MSVKRDFLSNPNRYHYIASFDFTSVLSMEDSCMLSYMIDLDDFKHADGGFIEVTPEYVQIKRPHWKTKTIRRTLANLVEQGLLKCKGSNGRGKFYAINIEAIYDLERKFNEDPVVDDDDQYSMQLNETVLQIGDTALPNSKSDLPSSQPDCRNRQAALPYGKQSITNQEHINNDSITNNNGATAPPIISFNQNIQTSKMSDKNKYIEGAREVGDCLNEILGSRPVHMSTATKKLITELFNKGYSLQDIKDVIRYKYNEWGVNPIRVGNGHMSSEYLTPKTLFGPKFQMYLTQVKKESKPSVIDSVEVYEVY